MKLIFDLMRYEHHPNATRSKDCIFIVVSASGNRLFPKHYAFVDLENYLHYEKDKEPRSWKPMPEIKKL